MNIMYNRIFTFGCSYTNYSWPTWADIIAKDLSIEYYNYGLAGLGNVGIATRILQADITHKFTKKDLVLILWSGWTREDRYDNQWKVAGNVYNNPFYDKKFLKKHWRIDDCIIKNCHAIISTQRLYSDSFQGHMNLFDRTRLNDLEKYWFDFYTSLINFKHIFENDKLDAYNIGDMHPTIENHIQYVNTQIYPYLNLQLKKETTNYFNNLHNEISKLNSKTFELQIKELWKKNDYIQ